MGRAARRCSAMRCSTSWSSADGTTSCPKFLRRDTGRSPTGSCCLRSGSERRPAARSVNYSRNRTLVLTAQSCRSRSPSYRRGTAPEADRTRRAPQPTSPKVRAQGDVVARLAAIPRPASRPESRPPARRARPLDRAVSRRAPPRRARSPVERPYPCPCGRCVPGRPSAVVPRRSRFAAGRTTAAPGPHRRQRPAGRTSNDFRSAASLGQGCG